MREIFDQSSEKGDDNSRETRLAEDLGALVREKRRDGEDGLSDYAGPDPERVSILLVELTGSEAQENDRDKRKLKPKEHLAAFIKGLIRAVLGY